MSKPDRAPDIERISLGNGMTADVWVNKDAYLEHNGVLGIGLVEWYEIDNPTPEMWDAMLVAAEKHQAAHA